MKNIITSLLLLPFLAFSQQKYYSYKYNNLYGITATDGTNIIDAKFTSSKNYKKIDSLAILKNDTGKTLLFNLFNGATVEYDEILLHEVFIENEYFSLIKNNGKQFLKGEKTGTILNLEKFFFSFENLGPNYIMGKVNNIKKNVKVTKDTTITVFPDFKIKKDKNGKVIPPPPPTMKKVKKTVTEKVNFPINYFIFKNQKKLELIKELNSKTSNCDINIYKEKYKNSEEIVENKVEYNNVYLNSWSHFLNEKFDYIAFREDKTYTLFTKDLKLIKKIESNKEIYYGIDDIQKTLQIWSKKSDLTIVDAGYQIPPSLSTKPTTFEVTQKDGLNIVKFKAKNETIFLFKTPFEVVTDWYDIKIIDANKNTLETEIDKANPKIYFPQKYAEMFQIDFNN